jgi:hypothetical protein
MPTEAAAMMMTKSALVRRLSLCRKRIMDGLEPSTLYAPAGRPLPVWLGTSGRRASSWDAQFSHKAMHCHYRRAGAERVRRPQPSVLGQFPDCRQSRDYLIPKSDLSVDLLSRPHNDKYSSCTVVDIVRLFFVILIT